MQQRVHNAGLTTAAIALSGLCLVGSKSLACHFRAVEALADHVGLFAGAVARLEGVNKPELLPKEFSTVIDVAGFLTEGEVGVDMLSLLLKAACTLTAKPS